MPRFDVRLRRIGVVPAGQPVILATDTIDYASVLSGAATLSFDAKQSDAFNGTIPDGSEVAVELWNGSTWAEPTEFSRYTVTSRRFDRTDPTLQTGFTCVDWVSFRLSKALLSAQETRTFKGTPGLILDQLIDEASARGWAPDLVRKFDATKDSAGVAWPSSTTIDLPADQPLLQTLDVLRDAGLIDWYARGHELIVHVREKAAAKRNFTIGSHRLAQPETTSIADLATSVIVRGEDGREIRRTGNDIGLGTLERGTAAGGVSDADTLGIIADAELAGAARKTELSVTEDPTSADRLPLVHYSLGDYVLQRRVSGAPESVRVSGVQIRKGSDSKIELDIQLMDRIADVAAKLAKRAGSLPATAGNGRARVGGGGGGGGASVRIGTVDPKYLNNSGAPARVSFDNGGTYSDPLEFISEHPPYSGDRVAVVGNVIVGRLGAEPGEQPGSVELIQPGPGWKDLDPARYGPLRIRKTASEWVFLEGMLIRDLTYTGPDADVVAYIPGAYRPERATVTSFVAIENFPGYDTFVTLTTTDGALRVTRGPNSNGLSMGGLAWNVSHDGLWGGGNITTTGGKDIHGTVFSFGTGGPPAGYRPSKTRSLQSGKRSIGFVNAAGNYTASYPDAQWWQAEDAGPLHYEWQRLNLINGYTHNVNGPIEFTKTPAGIVMIRGNSGGGGVAGQSIGQLPPGFRPSYEVLNRNDIRISPNGSISGLEPAAVSVIQGTSGGMTMSTMFIAGR